MRTSIGQGSRICLIGQSVRLSGHDWMRASLAAPGAAVAGRGERGLHEGAEEIYTRPRRTWASRASEFPLRGVVCLPWHTLILMTWDVWIWGWLGGKTGGRGDDAGACMTCACFGMCILFCSRVAASLLLMFAEISRGEAASWLPCRNRDGMNRALKNAVCQN